jgi:predicted DNA-binding transcriptional regulator AlpA
MFMEKLYNITEAKEALRISRASLYLLIEKGQLRPIKIGGRTLFTDHELSRFINSLQKKAGK